MCRLYEAIIHSGDAVKSCINEEFGDGIMSAIDFYFTLDKMKGTEGEARVVLTFNGKLGVARLRIVPVIATAYLWTKHLLAANRSASRLAATNCKLNHHVAHPLLH